MAEDTGTQNPFVLYDPQTHELSDLVSNLAASGSGFSVDMDSIELKFGAYGGESSLSFYDGSLDELDINPGLLMTSGDGAPPLQNSQSGYSQSFGEKFTQTSMGLESGYTVDQELVDVAKDAFSGAGNLTDATILKFDIEVTDPNLNSVFFDFAFGSEEYPNFIDSSFVDTAAILVNDTNYALFNGDAEQPLSVISTNVAMGNFMNNEGDYEPQVPSNFSDADVETVEYPIEYNAISEVLSVNAPVTQGTNTIMIGVSDTGDTILDTGMFVSGITGSKGTLPDDAGVISSGEGYIPLTEMGIDTENIISSDEAGFKNPFGDYIYDLPFDVDDDGAFVFGTEGMDGKYIAGSSKDLVDAKFEFSLQDITDVDFTIDPEEKYNFVEVDSEYGGQGFSYVQKMIFDDFAAAMDTWKGSDTWNTFSLLKIGFGSDPSSSMFTEWLLKAEETGNINELAGLMLDEYAPENFTPENLVSYLYQTVTGKELQDVDGQLAFLNGLGLETNQEILGFAAKNYADMSPIQGTFVPLDLEVLNDEAPEDMGDDGDLDGDEDMGGDDTGEESVALAGVSGDEVDLSAVS